MIRRILGFVLIALAALMVLKVALGVLGALMGLAVSVLVLAALGYVFYLMVRLLSPATADRIREMIRGTPKAAR